MKADAVRPWPDIAIPPGETLAETLEALRMSQADLARRMDRPVQAVNEIMRGSKEITPETAIQLERVLGIPAHVWVRLEADYRYVKARLNDQDRLKEEVALARRYPYGAMARLGWVAKVQGARERVKALLDFLGVSSLKNVEAAYEAAYRRAPTRGGSPEMLAAWLRQGERLARDVATRPFDEAVLRATLGEVRALTRLRPEAFERRLKRGLAASGVALVLVPHLPGSGAHGATRWLGPDKALVQMSLRYPWDDVFWFALYHELGHVLLHRRREVFIEADNAIDDEREHEASVFATDTLIPPDHFVHFLAEGRWQSAEGVRRFADAIGIAPSIVVGRLQHEGRVPYSQLNQLRSRFRWRADPRNGR